MRAEPRSSAPRRLLRPAVGLALACLGPLAACRGDDAGKSAGQLVYERRCAACHGYDGRDGTALAPPLVGHAAAVAGSPGGRERLIRTVLFGRMEPLELDGKTYPGPMLPMPYLRDTDVAAALEHVVHAWGNGASLPARFEPFSVEEVARVRHGLSARKGLQ